MQLELANVSHYHGRTPILNGLSLQLDEGEIGVLIGPSGAGKTTVLNCIAGLEELKGGTIHIGGGLASSADFHMPAEERNVGLMFQDAALFPHLSVRQNVAFGLRAGANGNDERVTEMLRTCAISDYADAYPHELSGGQQQRVALARALAPRPRLLLLDEPFSSADAALKLNLVQEVSAIIRQEGSTALLVTHDQNEAFALADRCGVIDAGSICQWDTAYNLYHRPNCAFVANFIGDGVLLDGKLTADDEVATELGPVKAAAPLTTPLLRTGNSVKMLLRPDDIVLTETGQGSAAQVREKSFRGAEILYLLTTERGTDLYAVQPSRVDLEVGAAIAVAPQVDHVVVFPSID